MGNSSATSLPNISDKPSYPLKHFGLPPLMFSIMNNNTYAAVMVFSSVRNPKTNFLELKNRKVVGRIENDLEYGRVIFKEQFIEEYPQLKNLTVYRQSMHNFVVVEQPYDGPSYKEVRRKVGRPSLPKSVKKEINSKTSNSSAPALHDLPDFFGDNSVEIKIIDPRYSDGTFSLLQDDTPDATGATGIDLRAMIPSDLYVGPQENVLIPTGIAVYIKNPYLCATILPRSGVGFKNVILGNLTGLIDADYQGQLMVPLWNRSNQDYTIKVGERIAQMVFVPIIRANFSVVNEFTASERGNNGFGSTGTI